MSKEKFYLIPDTNALVHYRFFDIRWRDYLDANEVQICFCPQVVIEVAKLKDMGEKKAIRKRAASLCQKLSKLIDGASPLIRDGETMSIHSNYPDLSKWNGLSERSQDDRIIAFALELKATQSSRVAIATADVSLGLRVRLSEYGLTNITLPDTMRLETADEDEKRIQQLEIELNRFKKAQPQLTAYFHNNSCTLRIPLRPRSQLVAAAEEQAAKAEQEARIKHPLRQTPSRMGLLMTGYGELGTEKEINEFNSRLYDYYQKVREHRRNGILLFDRMAEINLVVLNQGAMPASSVHAHFHFPDGFMLGDESFIDDLVGDEPKPPRTPSEEAGLMLNRSYEFQAHRSLYSDKLNTPIDGDLKIQQSNSYDVTTEFSKVRQGESKQIDTLYVMFQNEPSSFAIHYRLLADNAAQISEGKLSVVFE